MSTRCQIGFYAQEPKTPADLEQYEVLIYKHSDGYPDTDGKGNGGLLAYLIPFLKDFQKARGLDDTEYASARTLQFLANHQDEGARSYDPHTMQVCGFGICGKHGMHGDIEYFYAISSHSMKVFKGSFQDTFDSLKEIKKYYTKL